MPAPSSCCRTKARPRYAGDLGRAVCAHVQSGGGVLTPEDLAGYRVIRRRPVRGSFRGHELLSNPPPSSGGALIGYGLRLLEAIGQEAEGSAESVAAMVEVMREQARVRGGRFATYLHRGGLPRRLEAEVETALERIRSGVPGVPELAPAGTTHISVVDAAGNAASLSGSTGSGSGVVVPGTGIYLNNNRPAPNYAYQPQVGPGASNVIPGLVVVSVDVRAPDEERLERIVSVVPGELSRTAAVAMAQGPSGALREALEERGLPLVELHSGAGHDAGVLAAAGVPTAMLFVRSLNGGVSHSPEEHSDGADIEHGVAVLTGALRRLAAAVD